MLHVAWTICDEKSEKSTVGGVGVCRVSAGDGVTQALGSFLSGSTCRSGTCQVWSKLRF